MTQDPHGDPCDPDWGRAAWPQSAMKAKSEF
jgi:hypothetical protein